MDKQIRVTLTQTADGRPIARLQQLPVTGKDLSPDELRGMAHALVQAAAECEARAMYRTGILSAERAFSIHA